MRVFKDIALTSATAVIIPDDITGDTDTLKPYERLGLALDDAAATNYTVEFDYGLGFNESFTETSGQVNYDCPNVRRVRITANGGNDTATATFHRPLGGL